MIARITVEKINGCPITLAASDLETREDLTSDTEILVTHPDARRMAALRRRGRGDHGHRPADRAPYAVLPQPSVAELLTQLIEGQAAINRRLDAIEAAQERRFAEVRAYVLGLHDRLYDLHDAIEPLDDATRPDAAIVSLVHNADTTEED